MNKYDDVITAHYMEQAKQHGRSMLSTMQDEIIREKELQHIEKFVGLMKEENKDKKSLRILDLGCGNGYALSRLTQSHPQHQYWGGEFTEALLTLARQRELTNCTLGPCDARQMDYEDNFFDAVYTERCIINLLDAKDQIKAIREVGRVLKPNGCYLMIECFMDGLVNNNKARREFGLEDVPQAHHNLFFQKDKLFPALEDMFEIGDLSTIGEVTGKRLEGYNFLSSHYFMARVVYPAMARDKWVRNSEFSKFFAQILPPVGNYASIQAYVLRKKA